MQNSTRWIIPSCVVLLIAVILATVILWNETWFSQEDVAIHIVIDNRTNKQIGPFYIHAQRDPMPVYINQIEPFSIVDVYYKKSKSGDENVMVISDSNGVNYPVVPYFENQQKGRVDIRVHCATSTGLNGKIRHLTSEYFSMKWYPWGTTDCK